MMLTNTAPQLVNRRYTIQDKLGSGAMGAVFRVYDRLTGQTIALKRVLTAMEQVGSSGSSDSTDFRLILSREFQTLASLRHPHIVSVLDYGFDSEHAPYFTMNLVEGAQTLSEASVEQSIETRIRYIIEMLQALSYLHHRDILHRDLKPGNVLVDASGTVKMLDFGLSLSSALSMSNMEAGTVGTLAYMSPELFSEEEGSTASDLYAAGVVAYELLTSKRAFAGKNIALLVNSILTMYPDFSAIDENIVPVIERLLSKNPANRYDNADDVIKALCDATDYPLPQETQAIRESFLQTARLVGRSNELKQLRTRLNDAIDGKGGCLLLGGESGVGKSRLMEELRIRAMVKGVPVFRGEAVSKGGMTYHMWREVLRPLILYMDISEQQASVLKSLVPDIGSLLDRDIADADAIHDPGQAQVRFFNVIRDILLSQPHPMLIMLEDLQWAGGDSIALLKHMMNLARDLPILILGDFRDDEQADFSDMLDNPPLISLERLSNEDVAELSMAMLGEAGRAPDVIQLLQRESEGNTFFMIEVARALAEEAGQLHNIGSIPLPEKVVAGGINAILERRLQRVPDDARRLLQFAAIAGRQIDRAVLQALAPDVNLDDWLSICSNAAILDIQDERWRFGHSKLRDQLVSTLKNQEKNTSYQTVAEAIESVYPDDDEQAATLAHLWHIAEDSDKELHYARKAGFQAMSVTSNTQAIVYFERVLELLKNKPESRERTEQELEVQMPLSVALQQVHGYSPVEVEDAWLHSLDLCDTLGQPPQLVGALFGLCGVYMIRGEHDKAADMDNKIFELADISEHPNVVRAQASYTKLQNVLAMGNLDQALGCAKEVLHYYDPADAIYAIEMYGIIPSIITQGWIACILQIQGYPQQAKVAYEKALSIARELNHPYTLANVLTFSWVYQLAGDADTAYELSYESRELSNEYGFAFPQLFISPIMGWALAHRDETEEGIAQIRESVDMMYMFGALILRNYFLGLLAESYIKLGQAQEAVVIIDEALERAEASVDRFYEPEIHRIKGELLWQIDVDEAGAEREFVKAITISRERGAHWFELRATFSLALLWQTQGKIREAEAKLRTIYNWFTEGFDTPDLQNAKRLLDTLASM